MGSCNSTQDYQTYPPRRAAAGQHVTGPTPEDKLRAAGLAKGVQKALDNPKEPSYGWRPLEDQQQAVKLDPDNLLYRLNLMKLMGQQRGYVRSATAIGDEYRAARKLRRSDSSGELEICFVEAVLEYYSKSSESISDPLVKLMKYAAARARKLAAVQSSSERTVDFALAQLEANKKPQKYNLSILRYELAYLADPEPIYLLLLADITAIGHYASTEQPLLAFQRAEAALQAGKHTAYYDEMDLIRVANFYNAEACVSEGERLAELGDVVGAEAKAREAIELFPRYARPFVLLWECHDKGAVDDTQYLEDLETARIPEAEALDPPWIVHRRAREGMQLIKNGHYEDGINLLDWALRDQPNNREWLDAKRDAEADILGEEEEYLRQFGGITDVKVLRAGALKFWRKREYEKSARVLELAISRIPAWYSNEYQLEYAILHGERADSLYKARRYAEAEKEYDTAYKVSSKGGGAPYLADHIWIPHRLACLHLIEKPHVPLPQNLVWLKSHDGMHGFSGIEPPAMAWGALAQEYYAMKTLVGWRKAGELYEAAWKFETNDAQRSVWSARRKTAWDQVQRVCPDPVYVESEEHKRLRMQDIASKRRLRAKDGVPDAWNPYY